MNDDISHLDWETPGGPYDDLGQCLCKGIDLCGSAWCAEHGTGYNAEGAAMTTTTYTVRPHYSNAGDAYEAGAFQHGPYATLEDAQAAVDALLAQMDAADFYTIDERYSV